MMYYDTLITFNKIFLLLITFYKYAILNNIENNAAMA